MYEARNMGQRHNFIGMEGPFLEVEEDQESDMLEPVFHEYSRNDQDDITKKTELNLAIISTSLLVINYLNIAHNQCIEENNRCSKGLKIFTIEIGLFAATFLLAPVEIITRLALAILLAIPLAVTYLTSEEAFKNILEFSMFGLLINSFILAHGAVSTYTNLAYSDHKIDYEGQFRKFIKA